MATDTDRAEATSRLVETSFLELYRIFRACLDRFAGDDAERVQIAMTAYASGEPYVTLDARDGFGGGTLASLMDLAGENVELSVGSNGTLVYTCPSWPVPF